MEDPVRIMGADFIDVGRADFIDVGGMSTAPYLSTMVSEKIETDSQ